MVDLERVRMKREEAKLENNEAKAAKAEADMKMIEARQKLLLDDEDICPPHWDSLSGWVDVKVAKHYQFVLTLPANERVFELASIQRKAVKADFTCQRRKSYWKFGSFRVVYLCKIGGEQRVVKYHISPRGKEEDWRDVESTAKQYLLAHEIVKRFVKQVNTKQSAVILKMRYVKTDALALPDGQFVSTEECFGREFKESDGDFIKWNNNGEYVKEEDGGQIDPYPQALSHFSYEESQHTHLLTDVQGWRRDRCSYIFTDPAFHTNERKGVQPFHGDSDAGYKGMQNFFKNHKCNEICKLLELHRGHRPNPPNVDKK